MVHIATVHWKDERWIDVQLRYLNMHVTPPFKVYAFLNGLDHDHRRKYFYATSEPIESHPVKLNLLADMAAFNAESERDLLIFIDGDAFPIANVIEFARSKLREYPLVAVQRRENAGDIQPHPSFCVTTVKFWKDIGGDWKEGFDWKSAAGERVSDVGGNLLKILNERHIQWYPMLRSNRRNIHPLWFGLYDDIVYHHGAGFRSAICRADTASLRAVAHLYSEVLDRLPHWVVRAVPSIFRPLHRVQKSSEAASERVFASILSDPLFYEFFRRAD